MSGAAGGLVGLGLAGENDGHRVVAQLSQVAAVDRSAKSLMAVEVSGDSAGQEPERLTGASARDARPVNKIVT